MNFRVSGSTLLSVGVVALANLCVAVATTTIVYLLLEEGRHVGAPFVRTLIAVTLAGVFTCRTCVQV